MSREDPVTHLLAAAHAGEPGAAERLLATVYDELRKLAAAKLAREKPGQTLQATALVHEAWLRLGGAEAARDWRGRGHFFGAAAEAMRRILVEQARRKARVKRGGGHERVGLETADAERAALEPPTRDVDLVALDLALAELEREAPRKAELVKLRTFTGLSLEQAAEVLGVSRATAARDWAFAKAWLYDRLRRA